MRKYDPLVLVVDDVDAIVEELLTLLQLQEIPAIGARTLDEAVAMLERAPTVRIIACDVRLDRESGLDLVQRVQDNCRLGERQFHYVFITGDPMSTDALPATLKHSMLTKPVRPRTLIALFRELLAGSDV